MNIPTFAELRDQLQKRYGPAAARSPSHFSRLIPGTAPEAQLPEVENAIRTLTGAGLGSLRQLVIAWEVSNLVIANFQIGGRGKFADFLLDRNRADASNAWWETDYEERPRRLLLLAQGDPYSILLDADEDRTLAFVTGEGAKSTMVNVCPDASLCIRLLGTIQLSAHKTPSLLQDVLGVIGTQCDSAFWEHQIQHWEQFP